MHKLFNLTFAPAMVLPGIPAQALAQQLSQPGKFLEVLDRRAAGKPA